MPTLFTNVVVWSDGSSSISDVLVEGDRISAVTVPGEVYARDPKIELVDGGGAVLMPGLIDGHTHMGFVGPPHGWGTIPIEEHVLGYVHNARAVLDAGFTSAISGGAVKPRLDIAIRNEINAGRIPGPRMLACTPEMTCTGGLGDDRQMNLDIQTFSIVVDGIEEFRRVTRLYCREGVDVIKIAISGHPTMPHAPAQSTILTEAEVAAVTETARSFGKMTSAHARSNDSVTMCLRQGIDLIYHCEYADDETIDLLEDAKERIFLAPAFAPVYAMARENSIPTMGVAAREELERQFDSYCLTYNALRKRGVKVLIGGEYGLPGIPHGTNARDLVHFVEHFGYSNSEALVAATKWGAEAMRMGDVLGKIEPGFIADLLLVRGRPDKDVRVLSDPSNLLAIMKDGQFHKGRAGMLTTAGT
jgi:imidazolonepropionase-like amidohydrolase